MNNFVGKLYYAAFSVLLLCALSFSIFHLLPTFAERRADKIVPDVETTKIGEETVKANAARTLARLPVYFEQNQGQFDGRVSFLARATKNYSLFLSNSRAVYLLRRSDKSERQTNSASNPKPKIQNPKSNAVAVFMTLADANADAASSGIDKTAHQTNYLSGKQSDTHTDINNFSRVQTENVYDGVDLVWTGKAGGAVQYDFVVKPNADPDQIKWRIEGAEKIEIDESGDLLIETELGTIRQEKPYSYQETANATKTEVESRFVIGEENEVSFALGKYDRTKQLTIDPTVNLSNLAYSTFLGSFENDEITDMTVDSAGSVFVTGYTIRQSSNTPTSNLFPTTPGAYRTSFPGQSFGSKDVFVTKLNSTGSGLSYSTFIEAGEGHGIAVDSAGNACVLALASNSNYPRTGGTGSVFVTKLNAAGRNIIYSYAAQLGTPTAIAIDSQNNTYITGFSNGSMETTPGAFDTTFNGGASDAYVAKINAAGTNLDYSTYLGGSGILGDYGHDIAVDTAGSVYVTGYTTGFGFPVSANAYDPTYNGIEDAFVTRLNSTGSGLIFSTYLGGDSTDRGNGITIDAAGNVYLTGYTTSDDFPTTLGAYDRTYNLGTDVFVTKINATGLFLIFSTYIGGISFDRGNDITIDRFANIYVTGETVSSNYPTTAGAFDTTFNGDGGSGNPNTLDPFVTKLFPTGAGLSYSTYMGGSASDIGQFIALDSIGNVLVSGSTFGIDYPTTAGAFDTSYNGSKDIFISKFGVNLAATKTDFDGDGRTDISVFRPSNGAWYINRSAAGFTGIVFGQNGDLIAPADFDADGKTDVSVFRPSNGAWYRLNSKTNTFVGISFGQNGDLPRPADFDGDGKADINVFRPSNGGWYRLNSSTGAFYGTLFGQNGDQPLIADFDVDGKSDIAVFRPSNGSWYYLKSSDNSFVGTGWGQAGDIPTPGDFDGDGQTDISVFRPSNGGWYRLNSSNGVFYGTSFGQNGDVPAVGDFDGDGKADISVFRPSNGSWYRFNSSSGAFYGEAFGISSDKPIPAAFN